MKSKLVIRTAFSILTWSAGAYLVQFIILLIYLKSEGFPNEDIQSIIAQSSTNPASLILPVISILLFFLMRYWIRSYRKNKLPGLSRSVTYSVILPGIMLFGLNQYRIDHISSDIPQLLKKPTLLKDIDKAQGLLGKDSTFRSVHVFGIRELMKNDLAEIIAGGYEQLVVVPYAYMETTESATVQFNQKRAKRRDSIYTAMADSLASKGLQLIIKPHIWLGNPKSGKWRADITMPDEKTWQAWEESYRAFIMHYALLSEAIHAPVYCIGNELIGSTTVRPQFWIDLIGNIRRVYSGKLTYGANWDKEVFEIPFWNQLDYIGIQAYFPLVNKPTDDYAKILKGWDSHLEDLEELCHRENKPIIFTEIGYKSTENAAQVPWEWEDHLVDLTRKISYQTQMVCYQAFFEKVWTQEWMKGAWIWKWEARQEDPVNHDFTPKGKSAYYEIARHFGKEK